MPALLPLVVALMLAAPPTSPPAPTVETPIPTVTPTVTVPEALKAEGAPSPTASTALPPAKRFDHERHEKPFERYKLDCRHCHPFKLDPKTYTVIVNKEEGVQFVRPLKGLCHDCHRKEDRLMRSIFSCTTCHETTAKVIPESHQTDWLKRHAQLRYSPLECQTCHDSLFCSDCHRKFERIQPKIHSRNYRWFHSIEARVDPARCSSCHRPSTCRECHAEGKDLR